MPAELRMLRALFKEIQLGVGKGVLVGFVGHAQVREEAFDTDLGAVFQEIDEGRYLISHKAQAVHTRVQFDVDGVVPEAFFLQYGNQFLEGVQIGDGRLHSGLYDFRIEIRSGGEDQNGQGDTVSPQLQTLYRVGYGQVIGPGALHHSRELNPAVTVRVGLDQNQQFGLGRQQGAEISEILRGRFQIKLQPGEIVLNHIANLTLWTDI